MRITRCSLRPLTRPLYPIICSLSLLLPLPLAHPAPNSPATDQPWIPFNPPPDPFQSTPLDLRHLNESVAGQHGFVSIKDGHFTLGDGSPVRFWAVNGPPHDLKGDDLKHCARMLAKRGVNLVRVHGGYFDKNGNVSQEKVEHALEIVEAMKAEGIYTHFSIYFPLWIRPAPNTPWLQGYDGQRHPFAALFFNPDFQEQYRQWWRALLTTTSPRTGKNLLHEPAVAALEIQNEDSLFFWTFDEKNLPDEQLKILEKLFGDWLIKRHGSISNALSAWNNLKLKRDAPSEGRVAFRPLWNIFNDKKLRDQETAQFLLETQTAFYSQTRAFLRKLGFKGPITASNWSTASPEVFGPLEKLSYTAADFIDRHGYFSCFHKGDSAEWSIRNGHTYADRSALRFDPEQPGKPKQFVHPAMDPHYNGLPSMISETTWNRPNRYRSEAPLYYAAYGALQHTDAIVHFALDGSHWAVKPNFWMQPWTLMSPAMIGQFPAAALLYRRGLVQTGDTLAHVLLNRDSLLRLEGTPLPQDASLDELRLRDLPPGAQLKPGQRLDPLLHYAGRTDVRFVDTPASVKLADTSKLIDHSRQTVSSSTAELQLDYAKGLLTINAPRAQGASGALHKAGHIQTKHLSIRSPLELGHIIAVSLDDLPLDRSQKILLQVMSEEQTSGFQTEPAQDGLKTILNIGKDPWTFRKITGSVQFHRPDSGQLKVQALDHNGYPLRTLGTADPITLDPATLYYLVTK